MLTIRLQRVGKKNQASFRIVLAEKQRSATKKVVEQLGYYDPRLKTFGIKDTERLKYWISQHTEISPTMHNLLIDKGLLEGKKIQAWRPKKQAQTKTDSTQTATDKAASTESPAETKAEEAKPEQSAPTEASEAKEEQSS